MHVINRIFCIQNAGANMAFGYFEGIHTPEFKGFEGSRVQSQ